MLLKSGEWLVAGKNEVTVKEGKAQVKLHSEGTLLGRSAAHRDAAWLESNADKIYLGALIVDHVVDEAVGSQDGAGGRRAAVGGVRLNPGGGRL